MSDAANNNNSTERNMSKNQMIRKYNDHARTIATGFITNWISENIDAARSGNIPEEPTQGAWDMFRDECYPKYNTAAFTAQWANDRAFLLA